MKNKYPWLISLSLLINLNSSNALALGGSSSLPSLKVVPQVDIDRYLGQWFEIARYPNSFQKKCEQSTAQYSLRADGDIEVINQCFNAAGEMVSDVKGKAWVKDAQTRAKLKVSFFWPFAGNYWIIDLDEDYQYAVVSEPKRKLLWILSRTAKMDPVVLDGIKQRILAQGLDPTKLIMPGLQ